MPSLKCLEGHVAVTKLIQKLSACAVPASWLLDWLRVDMPQHATLSCVVYTVQVHVHSRATRSTEHAMGSRQLGRGGCSVTDRVQHKDRHTSQLQL